MEQRVSADARTGLTRRSRKLPAFVADVFISLASFFGFLCAVAAFVLGTLVWDGSATRGVWTAFVCFGLIAPILLIAGNMLDRRRKKWRDERRTHDEAVLTIGRDVLRFNGRTVKKNQITGVRVEKQKSSAPAVEGARVEVRYNVVLDVEGAKPVNALEALQEHELEDVLAAMDEGGLEVDR